MIVQRIISCKDEREGIKATLLFNVLHYAVRTWPWILTALASIIIYPDLSDPEVAYPALVRDLMPQGLKGLMVAGFFAAFMSTLSTYLNLSSAYFINDFYKPFIRPQAEEEHYVVIARLSMVFLSIITAIVTYYVDSIVGVFKFLIAFGSGTGLVYILRWFWWRINAWSEISAMIASTVSTLFVYTWPGLSSSNYFIKLLIIVSFSTATWLSVTLLTRPVQMEVLKRFYDLVRPSGPGWKRINPTLPMDYYERKGISSGLLNALAGSIFLISLTLGSGKMLLREFTEGFLYTFTALISGIYIYSHLRRQFQPLPRHQAW